MKYRPNRMWAWIKYSRKLLKSCLLSPRIKRKTLYSRRKKTLPLMQEDVHAEKRRLLTDDDLHSIDLLILL